MYSPESVRNFTTVNDQPRRMSTRPRVISSVGYPRTHRKGSLYLLALRGFEARNVGERAAGTQGYFPHPFSE